MSPAYGFDRYTAHGGPVRGLALSPDGSTLVTASFDYSAVVWGTQALEEQATLLGHEAAVNTAAFRLMDHSSQQREMMVRFCYGRKNKLVMTVPNQLF